MGPDIHSGIDEANENEAGKQTEDYAEDLSPIRLLEFAIGEAKEAVRMHKSIEKYEEKIERCEKSLKRCGNDEYKSLLREDHRLYKNGVERFRQDKGTAINEFLRLVEKFKRSTA